ncbi:HAD family hydrolase [Hutsoniella sourekii]
MLIYFSTDTSMIASQISQLSTNTDLERIQALKPIKIIFFDIDGTLIDMVKGHLTNLTLKTLQALKANDFILCLATGRSPVSLPPSKEWTLMPI